MYLVAVVLRMVMCVYALVIISAGFVKSGDLSKCVVLITAAVLYE
jgi:hypothetical protein